MQWKWHATSLHIDSTIKYKLGELLSFRSAVKVSPVNSQENVMMASLCRFTLPSLDQGHRSEVSLPYAPREVLLHIALRIPEILYAVLFSGTLLYSLSSRPALDLPNLLLAILRMELS